MLFNLNLKRTYIKIDAIPETLEFFGKILILQFFVGWFFGLNGFFIKWFILGRVIPPYYVIGNLTGLLFFYLLSGIIVTVFIAYEVEDIAVVFDSRHGLLAANLFLLGAIFYGVEVVIEYFFLNSASLVVCILSEMAAMLFYIHGVLLFVSMNQNVSDRLKNSLMWLGGFVAVLITPLGSLGLGIAYYRLGKRTRNVINDEEQMREVFDKLYNVFKNTNECIYLYSIDYEYDIKDVPLFILINKIKEWVSQKELNGAIFDDSYCPNQYE